MGVRIAVLAALAAVMVLILVIGPAPPPAQAQLVAPKSSPPASVPPPPPLFSPWYAESLRDILELEEPDVARLERQLAANPDDFPADRKRGGLGKRVEI